MNKQKQAIESSLILDAITELIYLVEKEAKHFREFGIGLIDPLDCQDRGQELYKDISENFHDLLGDLKEAEVELRSRAARGSNDK